MNLTGYEKSILTIMLVSSILAVGAIIAVGSCGLSEEVAAVSAIGVFLIWFFFLAWYLNK